MLHINDAKRSLKVDVAISTEMQAAIDQWAMMFIDRAPWLDDTTQSLGLPAAIAGEIARLTTVELESSITGSARADYLQGEYERVLNELRSQVETAAAGGGLVFKPYVDGERIAVDCVPAWRFLPTAFNSRGEVTGAVFVEQVTKGKTYYTRMEHHQLTDDGYTIRNLAYSSLSQGTLGNPCSLAAVDEWADLEPELTIRYKDGTAPEGVLFAYFRLPFSNTVDPESPLGVSVYSRAVGLIREADRQYSRILWEYEGSELAIDASQGALQVSGPDGRPATLPPRSKRLFRELATRDRAAICTRCSIRPSATPRCSTDWTSCSSASSSTATSLTARCPTHRLWTRPPRRSGAASSAPIPPCATCREPCRARSSTLSG